MHSQLAEYCLKHLPLKDAKLSESYYYASLPQCIIDAVYSIGVTYTSTMNVVGRYCTNIDVVRYRAIGSDYPAIADQRGVADLLNDLNLYDSYDDVAVELFGNKQRTSAVNGVLKAEAVQRFATVLNAHGVNYFQDVSRAMNNNALQNDIIKIPGQRSGVSWSYFLMLSGSDNHIKPDRMILRFVDRATGKRITVPEAQPLFEKTIKVINVQFPDLTLRELDYEIWKYERAH